MAFGTTRNAEIGRTDVGSSTAVCGASAFLALTFGLSLAISLPIIATRSGWVDAPALSGPAKVGTIFTLVICAAALAALAAKTVGSRPAGPRIQAAGQASTGCHPDDDVGVGKQAVVGTEVASRACDDHIFTAPR
jgi:O-antigen ligase